MFNGHRITANYCALEIFAYAAQNIIFSILKSFSWKGNDNTMFPLCKKKVEKSIHHFSQFKIAMKVQKLLLIFVCFEKTE